MSISDDYDGDFIDRSVDESPRFVQPYDPPFAAGSEITHRINQELTTEVTSTLTDEFGEFYARQVYGSGGFQWRRPPDHWGQRTEQGQGLAVMPELDFAVQAEMEAMGANIVTPEPLAPPPTPVGPVVEERFNRRYGRERFNEFLQAYQRDIDPDFNPYETPEAPEPVINGLALGRERVSQYSAERAERLRINAIADDDFQERGASPPPAIQRNIQRSNSPVTALTEMFKVDFRAAVVSDPGRRQ